MEKLMELFYLFGPPLAWLIYTFADAFADANQIKEVRATRIGDATLHPLVQRMEILAATYRALGRDWNANRAWHFWQALRQGAVLVFIWGIAYGPRNWPVLILMAALFWLLHDGIVNLRGLDRPWFYTGTTALFDRIFQKFPNPELAQGIAKCICILFPTILILFK